jgi:hypothetical protein
MTSVNKKKKQNKKQVKPSQLTLRSRDEPGMGSEPNQTVVLKTAYLQLPNAFWTFIKIN